MSTPDLPRNSRYERLPVDGRTFSGLAQYWLAEDHLLAVEVIGFKERYRRFKLDDLEALVLRPTSNRSWVSLLLILPAVPLLTVGVWCLNPGTGPDDPSVRAIVGGILLLAGIGFAAFAAIYYLAGPTCRVHLTTSVQSLPLLSLRRLSTARRFRDQVLAAAQKRPSARPDGASPSGHPPASTSASLPTPSETTGSA